MAYELIITLLAVLTVIGQLFVLFSLVALLRIGSLKAIASKIRENHLLFAFIVALVATLGSLFFSEIALFEPCKLCWFQRILMYPMVIILAVALIKKDTRVKSYALPLATIGICISAYHYYIQTFNAPSICSAATVSCLTEYILKFGYITIPLMAFTAFAMIIVLFTIYEKH